MQPTKRCTAVDARIGRSSLLKFQSEVDSTGQHCVDFSGPAKNVRKTTGIHVRLTGIQISRWDKVPRYVSQGPRTLALVREGWIFPCTMTSPNKCGPKSVFHTGLVLS